jgi:hypothetical protein
MRGTIFIHAPEGNERMKLLRRKRDYEVTTADSLEAGDFITGHRNGLDLSYVNSDIPNKTWVLVTEVHRFVNGDIDITFEWEHTNKYDTRTKSDGTICFPEMLVKRRVEQEQ